MHTSQHQWGHTKDDGGYWVLPDRVARFVDWLCNPDKGETKTVAAYAREVGIDPSQLHYWKRDRRVRDNIERKLDELNISPDRVQEVVNAMFKRATAGDTNAAKLYLQFIERLAPPKVVIEDKRVEKMSDAELAAALQHAQRGLDITQA